MVDNINDTMQRELNLSDGTSVNNVNSKSRSLHPTPLVRKISDHNGNHTQHQQAIQSPPTITTKDFSDPSTSFVMPVSRTLSIRQNLASGYDTDGAIGKTKTSLKPLNKMHSNYGHLVSPRLTTKRSAGHGLHQSHPSSLTPLVSQPVHLVVHPSPVMVQNHEEKEEESNTEVDRARLHIRVSRRGHQQASSPKKHGAQNAHSPAPLHHERPFNAVATGRPFRLIFMRHSERVNQALGSDWFAKAFRTGTYRAYDQNLPIALPKRRSDQAYEFDAPLTVRGLKTARLTGYAMLNMNISVDVCLSSTALRCIQTCERILSGMERRDHIPIRIEPGLFECPHLNFKITDSFMTKTELVENGYNIKLEYKPLIRKVNAPESLDEYFQRCNTVMRGIVDRYGPFGGTVLIVTHAPGLLALTEALKGSRPSHENFYRTVATYPPLAIYKADFDGTKWSYSEQPFSISLPS